MTNPSAVQLPRCSGAPCERVRDNGLSFLLDASQVVLAEEALGVNLVDLFRARRARGEPAILWRSP